MPEEEEQGVTLPGLKAWRLWKGWKQVELAQASGVTPATISRLEHGQPARLGTVAKLAKGLGIAREQLLHVDPRKQHGGA